MFDIDSILNTPPYSLNKKDKDSLYKEALSDLTNFHYEKSEPYKKILKLLDYNREYPNEADNLPFIPVRLFKEYELRSVPKKDIIKIMTSSGTTGQQVSKIYLDRKTAIKQTQVLNKIMAHFFGKKRLPMLIIDSESVIKNKKSFSARAAGVLGFSMFGRDVTYALDEKMNLNYEAVENFCLKHENENILIFGFTFMIWQHFYLELSKTNRTFYLSNASFLHGGGWKKLKEESVDNDTFKNKLEKVCGAKNYHNYYGMVEQTGSIFMECEFGFLHSSIFSDIIIRNPNDFSLCRKGEVGLIQLASLLPHSYPGHLILSEDLGEIVGVDNCPCGRLGKYFKVHGRIEKAEVRGCSDTYKQR